jgi:sporulation protein YlmC with PRC-barrel domain
LSARARARAPRTAVCREDVGGQRIARAHPSIVFMQRSPHMDTLNETLSHDVITSDRVEGTTVYNDAGDKLGSIDYLVIDKRSGRVRYAALEFGGFLGMGTNRYPVPWSLLEYNTDRGGYVVPITKETLDGAPRYEENRRPDYDDEYGRTVYDYYGVGW